MKISDLIEQLKRTKKEHGDIEVTCTASTDRESEDRHPQMTGGPFESTVENLRIQQPSERWKEKRVRLYW